MESIENISTRLKQKIEDRLTLEHLEQPTRTLMTFGEDALRFDFFVSVMDELDVPTHHIRLETPFDVNCFEENRVPTSGRGRKVSKPKYDLEVISANGKTTAAVEFGLFKQTEIAQVQDKPGRVGKLLNDFIRLSSLRLCQDHQKTSLYVVLLSDGEMINYGNGRRGSRPDPIFRDYELTAEYLKGLTKTTRDKIDSRFVNRLRAFDMYTKAKLIDGFSGEFGVQGLYKVAIWEISLGT